MKGARSGYGRLLVLLFCLGFGLVLVSAPRFMRLNARWMGRTGEAHSGGELRILGPDGRARGGCPLEHTDVTAGVAGYLARVRVRQTFHNPLPQKIEAVYVFPLPDEAA